MPLQCCGNTNYTDWFFKEWSTEKTDNSSVPQSCCIKTAETNCNKNVTSHPDTIYTKGCYNAAVTFFEDKLLIIGGVALGIAAFQLIGVALSCCLASSLQHSSKYELV